MKNFLCVAQHLKHKTVVDFIITLNTDTKALSESIYTFSASALLIEEKSITIKIGNLSNDVHVDTTGPFY